MDRSSVFLLCLFTVPRRDIVNFTLIASRGELPRHSNRLSRNSISMYGYRLSPALLTVRTSVVSSLLHYLRTVRSSILPRSRLYSLLLYLQCARLYSTLLRYLQCARLYSPVLFYGVHGFTLLLYCARLYSLRCLQCPRP